MSFTYPIVKLTDFEGEANWESLKTNNNVFALLVMAQVKAKRLKGNEEGLFEFRLGLTRSLYHRGYSREQVVELYHFIGWMIQLPELLEERLIEAVKVVEEELKMPYINTVERYGRKQGMVEGLEQGLEQGFEKGAGLAREKVARNMLLQTELNDQAIAAITELSIQEVMELRSKLLKES